MRRILLVIEDYNEALFLEGFLKKLGFDLENVRSESQLSDKMLSFAPDLVVATGDGKKISGAKVTEKVRRKGSKARLLLLYSKNRMADQMFLDNGVADGITETPVNPRDFVVMVCRLLALELEPMIKKFEKLPLGQDTAPNEDNLVIVQGGKAESKPAPAAPESVDASGNAGPPLHHAAPAGIAPQPTGRFDLQPSISAAERKARIETELKKVPPSEFSRFQGARIQTELKDLREFEKTPGVKQIDERRKEFVTALFKKPKS
jgi:CheY-like chemotaxis protein